MDLILVLDSSYSISVAEGEWGQLISFSRDVLTFLNIGESVRVGIVQFSNITRLEIGLTDDANAAINALDNMVKIDSYTALGEGLVEAEHALAVGGRENVTKFILVIGDGEVFILINDVPYMSKCLLLLYFFCRITWVLILLKSPID